MAAEPVNDDLSQLVSAAIKVSDTGSLHHYLEWNFRHLINELRADDLTDDEFMACNVVLAQALARKLALAHSGTTLGVPLVGRGSPENGRPGPVAGVGRQNLRVVDTS